MKEKKFKFEQTVVNLVETKYTYSVEAKTYKQAEKKLKEAFDKKVEKSETECKPIKKYLSKTSVVDTKPVLPELIGKSTLSIEFLPGKKTDLEAKQLYNNQNKIWHILSDVPEKIPTKRV
jgi:hypothetical protein